MKKLLLTVLTVLIAVAALQGCAAKEATPESVYSSERTTKAEDREAAQTPAGTETAPEKEAAETEALASTAGAGQSSEAETASESETPEESAVPAALTAETAYEGVSRYCRIELGFCPEESGAEASTLTFEQETEDEYQVVFRSYTGAVTWFYVDKSSGNTRMEQYVPVLNGKIEAGSINLFDYLSREITDDPAEPEARGHFVFQPKVCSVYMEEVFGKTMCDTWYALVDAVMAGEDHFACPDQYTYDWVMGQFPELCFPLFRDLIDYAYDRENSVKNGVASFTWLIPPEEASTRISAFAEQVEGILNEALADDYSDLEKVLALYSYFSDHYEYDYETAARQKEDAFVEINSLRFFETGTGICQEISTGYSYLLMQAGVEATVMVGKRSIDGMSHQWSYVRIDGRDYHVDPTYVLSDKSSLSYFMMTDERRQVPDEYPPSTFWITSNYSREHPHPDYAAHDDRFSPVWPYLLDSFDPVENKIYCWTMNESGERIDFVFDYAE